MSTDLSTSRPEEEVRTVLGNLCLARRSAVREGNESLSATLGVINSEGENRDLLYAERARLTEELHSLLAKTARLRSQVAEQERDRARLDGQREEVVLEVKARRQRTALLGLYTRQATVKIEKIAALAASFEAISARIETEEEGRKSKTYCSGKGVESEEEKAVREGVETVLEHMKGTISRRRSREGFGRGESRQAVLSLLEGVRPGAVLGCLVDMTREQTRRVKRRAEAEAGLEKVQQLEDGGPSVRSEISELCNLHIASCRAVGDHREVLARLEAEVREDSVVEEVEVVEQVRVRAEAASLKESMREVRVRAELREEQGRGGQEWVEQVEEQTRKTEDLCRVISLLVARYSDVWSLRL